MSNLSHQEIVERAIANNIETVMREGPGLRYSQQTVVLARDRVNGLVLLGGLGGMGVGRMWFMDGPQYVDYLGYADAPELDSTGGFGTTPLFKWHT